MKLSPTEERSLLKHPVEALLAVLLLVSLLFIAPDRDTRTAENCTTTSAVGCTTNP